MILKKVADDLKEYRKWGGGRGWKSTARVGLPLGTWAHTGGCGPVPGPASYLLRKTS